MATVSRKVAMFVLNVWGRQKNEKSPGNAWALSDGLSLTKLIDLLLK